MPTALAACEISSKGDIHVVAEPAPVKAATNFSLDQIAELAGGTGNAGAGKPLGFYTGRFLDTMSVSLETGPEVRCTRHVRIEIVMRLVDRRIEIGRELRQRPCLFSAAMQHYEKKAKADEVVFAQYVKSTAVTLEGTPLPAVAVQPDQPLDATSRMQIEQWVKTMVDQVQEPFHSTRLAAQQGVDTPQEMKRVSDACTTGI